MCVLKITLIYTKTSTSCEMTVMGMIMNIHIIGAGSLGLLYAGKLAASGCRVTVWCRSEEQAGKLRGAGITIEETEGSFRTLTPMHFRSVHGMPSPNREPQRMRIISFSC